MKNAVPCRGTEGSNPASSTGESAANLTQNPSATRAARARAITLSIAREVLSRPMRDRKAVARYAGLTGSPDESGAKRRGKGKRSGL